MALMRVLGLIIIIFFFNETFAQVVDQASDTLEYQEVVISRGRKVNFSNSHLKQISIERNNFLDVSGQTFLENLEYIPGIQLMVTGTNIVKPILRGMSLSRVWVGENYVKQEGQQWGLDHGLEFDPFMEGNITIVKGPSTILYGMDAIGGAIHVKQNKMQLVDTQQLTAMTMYKSVNDLFGINAQYVKSVRQHQFKIQASTQSYGDYKVPAESFIYNTYILPIDKKRLINTSGIDKNILVAYSHENDDWKIHTQASYFHQNAGLFKGAFGRPQSMNLEHDESMRNIEEPKQATIHFKYLLDIEKSFSQSELNYIFSFQKNNRDELSAHRHVGQVDNNALNLSLSTFQNRLSYKTFWSSKHVTQATLDVAFQNNNIGGYEFLIPQYFKNTNGLALLHSMYPSQQHKIVIGARLDLTQFQSKSAERNIIENGTQVIVPAHVGLDKKFLAVNTNVSWDYKFNDKSILQTQFSRVERVPNVAELASNGIHHGTFRHELGDDKLSNEAGYMLDMGWVYKRSKSDFHLTPYFYYFTNYIYLKPTSFFSTLPEAGQVYKYQENQALLAGVEAQWFWTLNAALKGNVSVEYVYAQNLDTKGPLPLTPPFNLNNKIDYEIKSELGFINGMQLSYSFSYSAPQNRVEINEKKTPGFSVHNLIVEKSFCYKSSNFKVDLQVKNLFNTAYTNHLSRYRILNLPEPGRNIAVSFKYNI